MLTELRQYIAKATNGRDDEDQIFDLSNFDIQEVSNVDAPANEQKYLLIKGALNMSDKALQAILGNGVGEFLTKLGAAAATGTKKDDGEGDALSGAGAGEGGGSAAPPALRLSETRKAESLQSLGVVISALITVAKAVDAAEVVAEGGDTLPDDLKTVVRSSSEVLGKMLGEVAAAPAAGEAGKAAAATAAIDKKKTEEFGETLETLGGVIDNLRTALGVKAPAADGGAGGAGEAAKTDPAVAKALDGIAQILKRQGTAITDMRGRVGLSSALPAEGKPVHKSAADQDFNGWPLDMNEDRRQAAR